MHTCVEDITQCTNIKVIKVDGSPDQELPASYRLPSQEEQVDEALYRQTGVAPQSQVLVLMGDFNHPVFVAGTTQQDRRFLECINDSFVFQVIEDPTRRGAMLDLVLTNKKGLMGNVKLKGSLGCSGHEMVEVYHKIHRTVVSVHSNLTILNFRRADYLGISLVEYQRINPWRDEEPKKTG
ncbi:dtw domain-containing protein 2 [Willisornis vidua]|uniref:Dtw domain-containing protein 2 n=1 Tax=Willisornis vidua TaxID=1566151 RepID=A0ABQ9DQK3_9PASS|nr:dtw domain-containing protein 2 [Willisornis vidua]